MKEYRVGSWRFEPVSGELARDAERRRLEPRAARTLEILCGSAGEVVPHQRLIDEVWAGRSLSDNSVSVVVGQLRRALDGDRHLIETVPKRGYRLAVADAPTVPPNRRHLLLGSLVALLILVIAAAVWGLAPPGKPTIAVADVVNATGSSDYDPLARATSELIATQLTRRGFSVRRGAGDADLSFSSRLVLWTGRPSLSMTATDAAGVARWSGMTNGTADQLPRGVATELGEFERNVARD